MTPAAEFIDLCKQLRALGAVKVAHGEFSVEFVPITAAIVQQSTRQPEPRVVTPEQAKEEERRRELGL